MSDGRGKLLQCLPGSRSSIRDDFVRNLDRWPGVDVVDLKPSRPEVLAREREPAQVEGYVTLDATTVGALTEAVSRAYLPRRQNQATETRRADERGSSLIGEYF